VAAVCSVFAEVICFRWYLDAGKAFDRC